MNIDNLQKIISNKVLFISVTCLVILSLAYFLEIFIKIPPCKLCFYQRIPYFLIILSGFVFYFLKKESLFLKTSLLLFCANLVISIYHSFLERGLVSFNVGCSSDMSDFKNIEDLREMLNNTPITKCDEITFSVLGLSLANINTILIIGLIYINLLFIVKYGKIK